MKSTLLKLLVALFTLSLVAAACGSDDDTADSGDSDALAEAEAALAAAEDAARDGFLVPLPDDVTAAVSENWSAGAMGFGNVDGTQYGVPDKTDLKSLVWYQPARFEANGYKVPTTLDELFGLAETMIADGNTPFCIGIESGTATGWTFTDWVEDMMLRRHSGETYDAWTTGELLFASDEVSGVMQEVLDVWNTPGMVYAQGGTIASTSFRDNGEPLVNGECMMHRQASFFSAFFPDDTPVQDGSEGAIDVFQFPAGDIDPPIVLTAGTLVGAFNDKPEVMAVPTSAPARSGPRARRSSTVRRPLPRLPPPSTPPGRSDPLRPMRSQLVGNAHTCKSE
ncbi:MAG: extracellular solute-binding protein [Actinobacteria bacterium]|nr:extracellular solute-binding protein [Actinomycetota bacterium]